MQRQLVWLWMCGMALSLLAGNSIAGELSGRVHWAQRVELGTPLSGIIVDVPVNVGDAVKKGQRLLQLESRGLKAHVRQAEAELASAKKEREEAQRELDRAKELYDRTLLSNHDLEVAKIAYAKANSRYQSSQAVLVAARLELEQSTILAPFDGVVLQRNAEVGQTVVSNLQSIPLVIMAATNRMVVHAEATSAQLERLKVKQKVELTVANQRFKGEVVHIGYEPLPGTGEPHYLVRVSFPTEGAIVRVGQSATVTTP